jgi:predicted DNA-binding ribbon-helix-helix protein
MLGGIQMSTMTIRLPDDKHLRLKQLAKAKHLSINKLVEELTTSVLSAHDAEVRFRSLALQGNPKKALALLDKLDAV